MRPSQADAAAPATNGAVAAKPKPIDTIMDSPPKAPVEAPASFAPDADAASTPVPANGQ